MDLLDPSVSSHLSSISLLIVD